MQRTNRRPSQCRPGFHPVEKAIAIIFVVALLAAVFVGCDSVATYSNEVHDALTTGTPSTTQPSTQPTTKPSAAMQITHDAAELATNLYPPLKPILGLVALLSGGIGTIAGALATAKKGKATVDTLTSAVTEIVGDVSTFQQPSEPWTASTFKLLTDLGHTAAALTEPATPPAGSVFILPSDHPALATAAPIDLKEKA